MDKSLTAFISIYWYHDEEPLTLEVDVSTLEEDGDMVIFGTTDGSSYAVNKKSFHYIKYWSKDETQS